MFNKLGGLSFLLTHNYNVFKLPIKLSKFYQQALFAWKLCYSHNFSPHKTIIWNNEDITVRNKSIFKQDWVDKGILFVSDLFDNDGVLLSYERFLNHFFPISSKEFTSVFKAIPTGLTLLMKSHIDYCDTLRISPQLRINNIELLSIKCNNKHIRNTLQIKRKISPRGKSFWNNVFSDTSWKKAWMLPYKFSIINKIKEVHIKILHNVYFYNIYISM